MPVLLRQTAPAAARRRAPAPPSRPRRRVGIVHGLDRVDREDVGRSCLDVRASTAGNDVSATMSRPGCERAEPLGAQAHLLGRLLAAHEQAPRARGGHRAERLEQQRALADARLAADQRDRARDEPAAEHPVELGHPGGPARRAERVDLGERHRAAQRGARSDRRRRTGGRRPAPRRRVPHSPQSGQRPSHFGGLVPQASHR